MQVRALPQLTIWLILRLYESVIVYASIMIGLFMLANYNMNDIRAIFTVSSVIFFAYGVIFMYWPISFLPLIFHNRGLNWVCWIDLLVFLIHSVAVVSLLYGEDGGVLAIFLNSDMHPFAFAWIVIIVSKLIWSFLLSSKFD